MSWSYDTNNPTHRRAIAYLHQGRQLAADPDLFDPEDPQCQQEAVTTLLDQVARLPLPQPAAAPVTPPPSRPIGAAPQDRKRHPDPISPSEAAAQHKRARLDAHAPAPDRTPAAAPAPDPRQASLSPDLLRRLHNLVRDDPFVDAEPPQPPPDPAWEARRLDRPTFGDFDDTLGTFVLRTVAHMTRHDIEALTDGPNNLLLLARIHARLHTPEFLTLIMTDWNTESAPLAVPSRPSRTASDCTVPLGTLDRDCPNAKNELQPNRARGSPAFLKIYPSRHLPRYEYVDSSQRWLNADAITVLPGQTLQSIMTSALQNYDNKDRLACELANTQTLVAMARHRLRTWYHGQQPAWNVPVFHHPVPKDLFQPIVPLRAVQPLFGSALARDINVGAHLATHPDYSTPNGFRPDGTAYPLAPDDIHSQRNTPLGIRRRLDDFRR